MHIELSGSTMTFCDVHRFFKSLSPAQVNLISQVALVAKFVLLMPATNAVSERSASALHRIKTYLRSTISQTRLNNIMLLHIHKHLTDTVDHKKVLNEFALANEERKLKNYLASLFD